MSDELLKIELSGTFPKVDPEVTEKTMAFAEEIMVASIQMNLSMGGRPTPFAVRNQNNSTPLAGSGKMYRGVMGRHNATEAVAYMDDSVVSKKGFFYPAALHYGAEVPPVEGKLMVFEIDGHMVFTHRRRGFHLGPFPFMIFQDSDIEKITNHYAEAIFIQDGERIQ